MNYKNKIDSQVSYSYVNPLYPKDNDDLTVRIRIANEVKQVKLFVLIDGCYDEYYYENHNNDEYASFTFNLRNNKVAVYYFALKTEDGYFYYSKLGLTVALPCQISMFKVVANLKPATWVSGSTCYQIFPDRFKNGNPNLNVKDGDYSFDGGVTKSLDFNSEPLEFDEGKCLDFFNGDLYGIIDSIDYLKSLNISAIYLNPIGVSRTTHRYDCCDFFHIDEKLGGDEAFIKLVETLHANNIKVIVDISINHTGIEHPWFLKAKEDRNSKEAKYYYINEDGSVACWFDVPTLPQLNYNSSELRDLIYRNENSVMQKFIRPPFNQDGWRLDVADVVGRRGSDQFCDEIWREVHNKIKDVNSEVYLVGEDWHDATDHLQGDQWDATMNYVGCGRIVRRWLGEQDRFLCDGWGQSPKKTNSYSGLDVKLALESNFNTMLGQMLYLQMNLIDSHDTPRLHNNKDVMDFNLYSGGVMLIYMLPGMPSVYYGDEVGLNGKITSVEKWRYPMQWDESKWNTDFVNLYRTLGQIREDYNEILKDGSYKFLNCDEDRMTFMRYLDKGAIILVMNRGKSNEFTIDLPNEDYNIVNNLFGNENVFLDRNKLRVNLIDKKSTIIALK